MWLQGVGQGGKPGKKYQVLRGEMRGVEAVGEMAASFLLCQNCWM